MSEPTPITNYINVMLKFPQAPAIYADGIKITDTQKVTAEHEGSSFDAFQYTPGVRDITYEIVNIRDHKFIYDLADKCVAQNYVFPLVVMCQNVRTQDWDVMAVLENCFQERVSRELGSHKRVTPTAKGNAFSVTHKSYEFD